MPETTPSQELRDAAKRVRADASWPAEELHNALADWLDNRAEVAEGVLYLDTPEGPCCEAPPACRGHEPEWGCDLCAQAIDGGCACGWKEALAVARAYPGMQPPAAPASRPRVVCLCGSTRFYETFREANLRLTLAGEIVLSIGCDTKSDGDLAVAGGLGHDPDALKQRLDDLHRRKIDLVGRLGGYVLVLNVGGYIGESTRGEIEYATAHGVPVEYLEAIRA